jgi:hypothetical protein
MASSNRDILDEDRKQTIGISVSLHYLGDNKGATDIDGRDWTGKPVAVLGVAALWKAPTRLAQSFARKRENIISKPQNDPRLRI